MPLKPPLATRCPRCAYLPASATVICPLCGHDRRDAGPTPPMKENDMRKAAKLTVLALALLAAGGIY